MAPPVPRPIVHLELHTQNLARACAFYAELVGWRAETVHAGSSSYLTLPTGGLIDAGVVESEAPEPLWIPYVEVDDVYVAAERAEDLGATVLVGPREGPAGWWGAIRGPERSPLGLWTPKGAESG
jgi:predicted enzyme related to lactoylglutathione lyase